MAAPFSSSAKPGNAPETTSGVATFERFDAVRLKGVFVPSNTTNMVHSEEMFALKGAIQLGRSKSQGRLQIENRSQFSLKSVALVERTSREKEAGGTEPGLSGMWIGELRPGESLELVQGQDTNVIGLTAVFKPMVAIAATDEFTARGDRWRVDGEPAQYHSSLTGTTLTKVNLTRVTG